MKPWRRPRRVAAPAMMHGLGRMALPTDMGHSSLSREGIRLRLYLLNIALDLLALALAFALGNLLVLGAVMGEPGKPHGLVMFAMIAPVYALLAINSGVYGLQMLDDVRASAGRAIWALAQASMLMLLIVYLGKVADQLSRLTFVAGLVFSAAGLTVTRHIVSARARSIFGDVPQLTAVILDGDAIVPPRHARIIDARAAQIDPERFDAAMAERLAQWTAGAERVIVACPSDRMEIWLPALKALSARCELIVPEMARFAPAKVGEYDHHPTVIVASGPMPFRDRIIKRLLDLVIAATATMLLSPLLIVIALMIKAGSPGPALFRQARLGRDSRPFHVYKFRTMRHDMQDVHAEKLTEKDDPRITRIGAFLRRTSLDELPQLFNVLKGDMSIVGPRPHAAAAKAADRLYWEVDPRYWARHCIKPGMTGLAQVRGHRGPTERDEDLVNRLQSDLEYVTSWSVLRDLRLIVATMRVLIHDNAF